MSKMWEVSDNQDQTVHSSYLQLGRPGDEEQIAGDSKDK